MLGAGNPRAGSLFHNHRSAFSFRRLERMAASTPLLKFLATRQAAPGLVLSPRSGATLARDVLRRCYTGCSLLCQSEMLSKF